MRQPSLIGANRATSSRRRGTSSSQRGGPPPRGVPPRSAAGLLSPAQIELSLAGAALPLHSAVGQNQLRRLHQTTTQRSGGTSNNKREKGPIPMEPAKERPLRTPRV
ncbi:unnamed protein product [Urochloa humidicola]